MNRKGQSSSTLDHIKPEPMKKIQASDRFPCFACYDHPKDKIACQECHGNGWVPGSHPMVQFAEDFIQKRLGNAPTSELTSSVGYHTDFGQIAPAMSRSQDPHKHPMEYAPISSSRTVGQGEELRLSRNQEGGGELVQQFFCDECITKQPIRGKRFHCKQCEDYDLCEGCFLGGCHTQHHFQQILPARRPDNQSLMAENKRVNLLLKKSMKQS